VAGSPSAPGGLTSTTPAAAPAARAHLILSGHRGTRNVALTFDADMTTGMQMLLREHRVARYYDPKLFALLRREHVPYTIFMTGLWAQTYPALARQLASDPSIEIENHSWDHRAFTLPCYGLPAITANSTAAIVAEVRQAEQEIAAVTGVHTHYFRFPGGCRNHQAVTVVAGTGEQPVQWDVDSGDAFNPNTPAIVRQIMSRTRGGSIVVMHLMGAPNAPATAAALTLAIPRLRAHGYRLVRLDTLLTPR
jgi:peptidoglycan/xylan/chitin deacetylase (PgdA/CDA1 family)